MTPANMETVAGSSIINTMTPPQPKPPDEIAREIVLLRWEDEENQLRLCELITKAITAERERAVESWRASIHEKWGGVDESGKCQCAYCRKDFESVAERLMEERDELRRLLEVAREALRAVHQWDVEARKELKKMDEFFGDIAGPGVDETFQPLPCVALVEEALAQLDAAKPKE